MEHVLEHVLDPEAAAAPAAADRARRRVRDHRAQRLQPVAAGGPRRRRLDRDFWLAPPQHLNYFEAGSLTALLSRLGFEIRIAYASFPIDWYLLHPGSNYIADPAAGKPAHRARMAIDLMLAEPAAGLSEARPGAVRLRRGTQPDRDRGARRMKLRYVANACFLITLAGGRRILTDPWYCGPCQQTWWNFPPVHERLADEMAPAGRTSSTSATCTTMLRCFALLRNTLCLNDALACLSLTRQTAQMSGAPDRPPEPSALAAVGFAIARNLPAHRRIRSRQR